MNESEKHPTWALIVGLSIAVVICFSAAAIGGLATSGSVNGDWFTDLKKPNWNPPNWVFGPVWSVLYFLMAISAWLVWKQSGWSKAKLAIGWFVFHLGLNALWSIIFFGLEQPGWAAIEIFILWMAIAVSIVLFRQHSKLAACLLVPYLLWVSFATFLNVTIWSLN